MQHLLDLRKRVHEELGTTRLVRDVLEGRPSRDGYVRYLENVRYYAQFSPVVMATAAARAVPTHPELARYLLHHADEETGHDLWALADLEDLGVPRKEALAATPVPACQALVGYVHYVAGFANPVGLFGWMYILEAVGNDLGTLAGAKLARGLGDAKGAVRFVAGHGVADTDHTREITEQLEAHVRESGDRAAVDGVADVVTDLYLRMFREIGGERARWD